MDRIILNKTRSSKERFYLLIGEGVDPIIEVNKQQTPLTTLLAKDTLEDRTKVVEYLTDDRHPTKGQYKSLIPIPKGWDSVDTSVEADPAPYTVPKDTEASLQAVRTIIHGNPPGSQRDTLVAMLYGDINRTTGKGASRKLRKAVRDMGFNALAALPPA